MEDIEAIKNKFTFPYRYFSQKNIKIKLKKIAV